MKLEDQVCSLELAKQLKRLGVKQSSLFFWEVLDENAYGIRFEVKFVPYCCSGIEKFSAFTVSELLYFLPNLIKSKSIKIDGKQEEYLYSLNLIKYKENYSCQYGYEDNGSFGIYDEKPSNACAKMLIYLIENNIWKSEQ